MGFLRRLFGRGKKEPQQRRSRQRIGPGYFEVPRPSGDGLCSDRECPCGIPGEVIPRGTGYLYISQEVVDFRRDAPGIDDVQAKARQMERRLEQQFGPSAVVIASGMATPILVCEKGARKRKLNLEAAAADATEWWETGLVPLRATPLAKAPVKREVVHQDPQTLVDELWITGDPSARRSAARALGKLGAPAVEPLIAALRHRDTEAPRAAARVLGRIGDPRAVKPLVEIALEGESKTLRADAGKALVKIGEPAVKPLIAELKCSSSFARLEAADVLGRIGDPRAVKPLIAGLDDPTSFVRTAALRALGRIGDVRAVEPLVEALKDKDVRATAARWLVKFGEPSVAPLVAALEDEEVRRTAAGTLVKIGELAVEPLIAALENPEPGARKAAVGALKKLAEPTEVDESLWRAAAAAVEQVDVAKLDAEPTKRRPPPKVKPKAGRGYNFVLIVGEAAAETPAYQRALDQLVQRIASEPGGRLAGEAQV